MSSSYVRSLGRLIGSLSAGAGNDVVGSDLAAVVRQSRSRALSLAFADDGGVLDGDVPCADNSSETASLSDALKRHGLRGLQVDVGATDRELLQLAALLAGAEAAEEQPSLVEAARRLGFWHITPISAVGAAPVDATSSALPEPLPLGAVADAESAAAELEAELDQAVTAENGALAARAMARAVMTEQAALDAVRTVNKSETGEDELASLRARAARWTACVGHVITPPSLRLVAGLLASSAVSHEVLVRVLRRAGNDATSILMQHLTAATSLLARRVLFDVIIELGVGVPVLVAHLQHRLWFVVRNAACLLGALRAPEAETALVAALSHADERVRTAAATALMQLATPSARRALEGAIRDSSSDVRRRALRGLLHGDGQSRSAAVLSEAVDLERDEDVQLEVVSALRELATSFAAQQLSRLCSPSVTAGKSVAFRRAALEALVAVRPTAALPLLRLQSKDRDADVRAFATELLARVSRAA